MTTKTKTSRTTKATQNKYARDDRGLLTSIPHEFNEDGSVNWKKMIPSEYIVINEETVTGDNDKDVNELEDYQKLILLAGTKELARIRGLTRRDTKIDYVSDTKAVATCSIEFVGNFETGGIPLVYSDSASATIDNAGSLGSMYLETIASNRAFVRAVRNALNIHILSADEISVGFSGRGPMTEEESMCSGHKPYDILAEKAKAIGYESFEQFKKKLEENKGVKNISLETVQSWEEWKDIDPKSIWTLIPLLNNKKKS